MDPNCPRAKHTYCEKATQTLPKPELLDMVDTDQADDVRQGVDEMIERAKKNGLPREYHRELEDIVMKHIDIFRTGLSAGPPAFYHPYASTWWKTQYRRKFAYVITQEPKKSSWKSSYPVWLKKEWHIPIQPPHGQPRPSSSQRQDRLAFDSQTTCVR